MKPITRREALRAVTSAPFAAVLVWTPAEAQQAHEHVAAEPAGGAGHDDDHPGRRLGEHVPGPAVEGHQRQPRRGGGAAHIRPLSRRPRDGGPCMGFKYDLNQFLAARGAVKEFERKFREAQKRGDIPPDVELEKLLAALEADA